MLLLIPRVGVGTDLSLPESAVLGSSVLLMRAALGCVGLRCLAPVQIREIASALGVNPTKKLGQNLCMMPPLCAVL